MIVIMSITGKPLKTEATPSGILNLELANSHTKVQRILLAWNNASTPGYDIIAAAKSNTYFDFLFLLSYAFFLFSCCKQLSQVLQQKKIMAALLQYVAWAALLLGFLDILENIGMLQSLAGNGSQNVALFTSTISIIKWLLVLTVLALMLVGLVAKWMQSRKPERL
jgi:hypothetical protein